LADRYPEITPFGGVHIDDDDPFATVREAVEVYGMAGFKFHPMVQRFYPWDRRMDPILVYLNEHELPMYVHTGFEERYNHEYDQAGLEAMLVRYPNLPVVLAHVGFPKLEWAFNLADRFPQIWLDLTNVPGSIQETNTALADVLREGVWRHRDRALMGTDYPGGNGTLEEILGQYESIGLGDELLRHLMLHSTKDYFDRYGTP
jgi:hypothetical protein